MGFFLFYVIQELSFILESNKSSKKNLFITFINIPNAFGTTTYNSIFSLFRSHPITREIKQILKDLYSNVKCQKKLEFSL